MCNSEKLAEVKIAANTTGFAYLTYTPSGSEKRTYIKVNSSFPSPPASGSYLDENGNTVSAGDVGSISMTVVNETTYTVDTGKILINSSGDGFCQLLLRPVGSVPNPCK